MNESDVKKVQDENRELLMRKNRDYGSKNIEITGISGVATRMQDKVSRILNLTKNGQEANFESLRDTFGDIANYGVIGQMLLDGTFGEGSAPIFDNDQFVDGYVAGHEEGLRTVAYVVDQARGNKPCVCEDPLGRKEGPCTCGREWVRVRVTEPTTAYSINPANAKNDDLVSIEISGSDPNPIDPETGLTKKEQNHLTTFESDFDYSCNCVICNEVRRIWKKREDYLNKEDARKAEKEAEKEAQTSFGHGMVYLAGPIDNVSRDEAMGWRQVAKDELDKVRFPSFNPATAISNGPQDGKAVRAICRSALDASSAVIVYLPQGYPAFGTIIELIQAQMMGLITVIVSDWVQNSVFAEEFTVVTSIYDAVQYIVEETERRAAEGPKNALSFGDTLIIGDYYGYGE